MEAHVGVAKTHKYAVSESGDTVEMVERPRGGFSLVIADGQGAGPRARRISQQVVSKAVSLLGEGARDGAVARAVHDHLFSLRDGKVSATLGIVSLDLDTRTLVLTQSGNQVACVRSRDQVDGMQEAAGPIGVHSRFRPRVQEYPLESGLLAVVATDGVSHAGRRRGRSLGMDEMRRVIGAWDAEDSQALADELLYRALLLDENRPDDDMSVVAVTVLPGREDLPIRRMSVGFPFR